MIVIHSMQDWTATAGMELQEKKVQKDTSILEICLEGTYI